MQILRVFISSPGDVGEERGLARRLLKDELPFDPLIRGLVHLDPISWDDPTAPTPLPANLTPQEALFRFGPKPSQCDIVVVILWSRLGTHLDISTFRKPNGDRYLSGTEWEYEDAWNNRPRPDILVYRRMEVPKIGANDPKILEKIMQYELVGAFFDRFENRDGSSRNGWAPYNTPTGFRDRLETDLKSILRERLDGNRTLSDSGLPVWGGSPYPGLRTFTFNEASIFFGRGREVDALVAMMRDTAWRFIAVLGASGTGKSSIIRAGLLPRLATGAIEGSQHWHMVSITPGTSDGNPLSTLLDELRKIPSALATKPQFESPIAPSGNPRKSLVDDIMVLANAPARAELLLFVDQFEEVFTLVSAENRNAFLNLLNCMVRESRLRVLVTIRTDFLSKCTANPDLAELLQTGSFVLGAPGPAALVEIIRKPAERAGLEVEDALVDAILNEAGGDPGTLPLIAFCLEELYRQAAPGRQMTLEAFKDLGRLQGAISRRTGALLGPLRQSDKEKVDIALSRLFQALVNIDASGSASRRWASAYELSAVEPLLTELIRGRLLVADEIEGRATITLAHEALIREWPDLKRWLDANTKKLRRVQRALDGLEEPEPTDRRNAVSVLLDIGTANVKVVPALLSALDDTLRISMVATRR